MTRQRGATVLEVVVALSVLTILLGAAMGGVRAHQLAIARSYAETEAWRVAGSRLEEVRASGHDLEEGETRFATGSPGARGLQRVRRLEPGLYAVEVAVERRAEDVRVVLATLVVRETEP